MTFGLVCIALGLLTIIFSQDFARGMNGFDVWIYRKSSVYRKIPLSRLAGSSLSHKSSLWLFRILGAIVALDGLVSLGFALRR
jgi:hypothetical protein